MSWEWTPECIQRLEGYLSRHGLIVGPIAIQRIGDGHSNLTFLVSSKDGQLVVRRPPPPPVPRGAHDVLREARLISALADSGVPVPKVLGIGQSGEVMDVPFFVMEYIDGAVMTYATPPSLAEPRYRRAIAETLFDNLAVLHAVDWRTCGLADFGRPEEFNRRHLGRIARLIADDQGKVPPPFARLYNWLEQNVPPESGASIIHNDFRLGNLIWAAEPPVRLLAVLDWELATIGDPLLDVGYALAAYPQPGEESTPTQDFAGAMFEPGYPSRDSLARRYAERTGRDLSYIGWYRAMAEWKLAILYEYSRRRGEDPYYADARHVPRFLNSASRAAGLVMS